MTRHSSASAAIVRIHYGDGDVTVLVNDDGAPTTAPAGDGTGIRGMRDRAEALGGDFEAGAGPEGGFTIRARLPA